MDDTRRLLARIYVRQTLRHPLTVLVVAAVSLGLALGFAFSFTAPVKLTLTSSPAVTAVAPRTTATQTTPKSAAEVAYSVALAKRLKALNAQDKAWWAANGNLIAAFMVASSNGHASARAAFADALTSAAAPLAQVRNANDLLAFAADFHLKISMSPSVGSFVVQMARPPFNLYGGVGYTTKVSSGRCVVEDLQLSGVLPRRQNVACEPLPFRYFIS